MNEYAELPISVLYDCTRAERGQASELLAGRPTQKLPRRPTPNVLGWLLFIGLAVMLFMVLAKKPASARAKAYAEPKAPPVVVASYLLTAGLACCLAGYLLVTSAGRRRDQRWYGQLTYSFDAVGLTQKRPGRVTVLHWERFIGLAEGPDVFVLKTEARKGVTVPKRLFAGAGELQRVRALLQEGIVVPPPVPRTHGFPVQPL
jgi:hypothetical protein